MTREEAISRIQQALNVPNRLQGLVLIDEESANMAIEALSAEAEKTYIVIDIPYVGNKGIATLFKGEDDKFILEEVKEIMAVVRCKDCIHYNSDGGALMVCNITEMITDDNDFCSYGERREP